MSSEALAWAFKQECKSASVKFTLVALCECANYKTGRIMPSIEHLTEITGQNRKTIIANVAELEAAGFIRDTGERVGRTMQIKVYEAALHREGVVRGEVHYVYRLTDPAGAYYIGVRTCVGSPDADRYAGSGRWPQHCAYRGVVLTKSIVSVHDSRTAAEVAEAMAIKAAIGDALCMNIEYKDTEKGIPNLGPLKTKSPENGRKQSQKRDTEPSLEPSCSTEPNGSSEHSARAKPHRMLESWEPGPLPPTVSALTNLWPDGRLAREVEQFRDYWLDRTEKRPGWDRTFHNRIRDIHDRVLRESSHGRQQHNNVRPIGGDQRSKLARAIDEGLDWLGSGPQAQVS